MNITIHPDSQAFLQKTLPFLRANEAANNLMLGIALRLEQNPNAYSDTAFLATVEGEMGLVAAALMTPPYPLLIHCACEDCASAWPLVIGALREGGWAVPGVNGQLPHSRQFAEAWQAQTGERSRLAMRLRVFVLREVHFPPPVSGGMRPASADDFETVHAWTHAFQQEAVPHDPPPREARTHERIRLGEIFLWEDGGPVCMAATARPLGKGITIGLVYTPPDQRRKGYAAALVAALSQRMLEGGYEYCSLFTDLSNPTSNAIYQRIGYRPVCDYEMYGFGEEENGE